MAACFPSKKGLHSAPQGFHSSASSRLDLVQIDKSSVSDLSINLAQPKVPTGRVERKVSSTRMLINLLKGMIGPGCLSLPLAFGFSGLWVGLVLTFLIGALNTHCMQMLVKSAQYLCKRFEKSDLDYGHLSKKAMECGPPFLQRRSKIGLYVTNATVAIFQLGVCSVQIVFMAANLQKVESELAPNTPISIRQFQLILLVPTLLVVSVRNLKVMAYCSIAGNIALLGSLVIILQYTIRSPNLYYSDDVWFMSFQRLLLYLGAILFSFEGQAMILPMENEMREPKHMSRPFGVLHTGLSLVTICYATTGFFGYLKFGTDVQGSITLNMPAELLYQIVNLLLVLVILLGLPLQFYVLNAMFWPSIKRKLPAHLHKRHLIFEYLFRTAILLLAFVLGIAIPNLAQIIPLVGISAGCTIALILPPIIHTFAFWQLWREETTPLRRTLLIAKNTAIALFGVFGLCAGLYASILQLLGHVS
jgi:proton-coupled amino acid transporter